MVRDRDNALATRMGVVFAVELVPFVLFGVPAGSIVDKLGPRATMLISDRARAPIIAAVPFLHAVGGLMYPIILAAPPAAAVQA